MDADVELLLACGLWLPVDEADDKTKELSELSELGLGADVWMVSNLDPTFVDEVLPNLRLETRALVQ